MNVPQIRPRETSGRSTSVLDTRDKWSVAGVGLKEQLRGLPQQPKVKMPVLGMRAESSDLLLDCHGLSF